MSVDDVESRLTARASWGPIVWALVFGGLSALCLYFAASTAIERRGDAPQFDPVTVNAHDWSNESGVNADLTGYTFDCGNVSFDGNHILAWAPNDVGPTMAVVRLEHTSECDDLGSTVRGELRAWDDATRSKFELAQFPGPVVEITPVESPLWTFLGGLLFAGITALILRSRFKKPVVTSRAQTPRAYDDRAGEKDPYRPAPGGKLIDEELAPSPDFLGALHARRVRLIRFGVFLTLAGLALAAWGGHALYERETIWEEGMVATDANVEGRVTRHSFIGVSVDLTVAFVDNQGRIHREEVNSYSLIQGVDDHQAPHVRFMPDDPRRFTVSWVVEQFWGSFFLLLFGVGLIGGLGVAIWMQGRSDREPERARAVFDDPREVLLQLIHIEEQMHEGQPTGHLTYHYRVGNSERSYSHNVLQKDPRPLFVDPGGRHSLGLYNVSDPDYVLVLSEGLRELHDPPFGPEVLRGRYLASRKDAE